MSIIKSLIAKPRPCPFCGGEELELRAIVFRQWNIYCLHTECLCKGPDGKTPDLAVSKWNSMTENSIRERENMSQLAKDYQNSAVIKKIWKATRSLRSFSAKEVARVTECHLETVKKYLSLLKRNEYLRLESQKDPSIEPNIYRCIKPRTVNAPSWLDLQLSPREYQVYREEKKSMKWTKIQAVSG